MKRLLVAIALVAGCDDGEIARSTTIDAPRVLAIQAEPPVVSADGEAAVRALIVDGGGDQVSGAAAGLTARACSPWIAIADPARDCDDEASVPLPVGDDGAARLVIGEVLARFPPPGPPPAGGGGDDDPCPVAYDHVDLPVIVEAEVEGVRLTARKAVRVTLAPVIRANPALGDLLLDDAAATTFRAGAAYDLTVRPMTDALDDACTDDDPPVLVAEPLRIHLFTTAGELEDTAVDASYDAAGVESLDGTVWTAPERGGAVLWAVAVDGDGGIAWQRYDLAPRE